MSRPASKSPGRVACLAAAGLLWRSGALGLPPAVAKYGGSALWGAMVLFAVGVVLGRRPLVVVALCAAAVAAAVEASQAIAWAPLDAVRAKPVGALLLGRTFDWKDIAFYWAGVAAASAAIACATRLGARVRRAPRPPRAPPPA